MKTVFIWPNIGKENMADAVEDARKIIAEKHAEVILPEESRQLGLTGADVRYLPQAEGIRACDFILSLGGDGTILRIAELAALENKPLLGVNFGHVGFMTELERMELGKIRKVFEGKFSLDERMMLELRVKRDGQTLYRQLALNDVTVSKAMLFRVIQISIRAGGVPVTSFMGDGVVVATPTGSTGYSLSAGGAILEPAAENIAVTPICAHNFYAKSFVFAPEREISLAVSGPDGSGVCVSVDGRGGIAIRPDDQIFIRKATQKTQLIRVKGKSFYNILQQKLSGRE